MCPGCWNNAFCGRPMGRNTLGLDAQWLPVSQAPGVLCSSSTVGATPVGVLGVYCGLSAIAINIYQKCHALPPCRANRGPPHVGQHCPASAYAPCLPLQRPLWIACIFKQRNSAHEQGSPWISLCSDLVQIYPSHNRPGKVLVLLLFHHPNV